MIITLCADPNDGTHGLFIDGKLALDSDDEDVTSEGGMDFWRDALDAAITALGGTLVEETRYRPRQKVATYDGYGEWESFWPDTLDKMGPVEPPYEEPKGELTAEDFDPNAEWNTAGYS
jgi:hypothetical protein